MSRRIPIALHVELLRRADDGATCRELADWLGQEHGVEVKHNAVARLLKSEREKRDAQAARALGLGPALRDTIAALEKLLEAIEVTAVQRQSGGG